jgi:isopropylmalate/homocitrate/citramalate synthase
VPIDIDDSIVIGKSQICSALISEIMQGSEEVESKLSEMIHGLEDECASDELEKIFERQKERDKRIDETFEDLFEEVDRLILLAEDLEKAECDR